MYSLQVLTIITIIFVCPIFFNLKKVNIRKVTCQAHSHEGWPLTSIFFKLLPCVCPIRAGLCVYAP